jgi:hypothetical protein
LLAGGKHLVQLARIRPRINAFGELHQAVGFARHSRDHHHDPVAALARRRHLGSHMIDAFRRTHRGAAILLYQECHRIPL